MPDAVATKPAVFHSSATFSCVAAPEVDLFREVRESYVLAEPLYRPMAHLADILRQAVLTRPITTAIWQQSWLRPGYWAALGSLDALRSEPTGLTQIALWGFSASETGNVTSETELLLLDLTQLGVKLPEPAAVREYLIRHPDLLGVVRSVCGATWDKVGARSQLSLELYRDPEIEDEHLVVYVRQRQYDERLIEEIQALCEEYEGDVARTSGWLLVTTDFQPPR